MRSAEHRFEDAFLHAEFRAGRIRIVPREQAEEAKVELRLLFPHEPVQIAPMGCPHVCLYTGSAPASLVAERIDEHLEEIEHKPMHH